jgi:exodeoxyribonuclease V alpha subunit
MHLSPESADLLLAKGFADRLSTWARTRGTTDSDLGYLYHAAHALSLANGSGHVCLPLSTLHEPGSPDYLSLKKSLQTCPLVGSSAHPDGRPLVLDTEDRLYLHRHFDDEQRLARRLQGLARATTPPVSEAATRQLAFLFDTDSRPPAAGPDHQKHACELALRSRLTVISGGPGTGKTTTVVKILACLLAQEPHCQIRLAAPTGKAAARLVEALGQAALKLPPPLAETLPVHASTVHRLLGFQPRQRRFLHNADHPLDLDVLVIDEASMLDLALARRLVEAVPEHARLIFLGDKDQLSAVDAGAVFADLSGADGDLARCVAWLTESFRFDGSSGIGRLARCINEGNPDGVMQLLAGPPGQDLRWISDNQTSTDWPTVLHAGLEPYLAAARAYRDLSDRAPLFQALNQFRVLCAERHGPHGVMALNQRLGQYLRRQLGLPDNDATEAYPFRPVIVLSNDHALSLFNGDIGIMLPDTDGQLRVHFAETDGGYRTLSAMRLPEHDTALALTVHRAQGSEHDTILLVLPTHSSRVLTREWLYTAATRARRQLTILGNETLLRLAVHSSSRRHSGLHAQLASSSSDSSPTHS